MELDITSYNMYIAGIKSNVSRKIDCERRDMPSAIRSENMELRSENHQIQPDGVLGNEAQHFLGPVGGVIGTLGLVWGAFSGGVPTPDAGSNIIDEFLNGGYDKDIISTIYGPASSGKTTFCLLAGISIEKQGKKVIFVDTEGGFSLDRFKQLIKSFGADPLELLKNIFILKPTNFQEQHHQPI